MEIRKNDERSAMKIRSKKLLVVLLSLPVFYALFLTSAGIIFGTHETIFKEAESVLKLPQRGIKPLIFSVPITYDNQAVYSYAIPKECYLEDGECHRTGYLKFSYDYLRNYAALKVKDKDTQRYYLWTIAAYEKIAGIEKINDFIPWELWALLGAFLAYQVVRRSRLTISLLLWWWYTVWAIIGNLGFYAVWRTGFNNTQEHLETAFFLARVTHHFETTQMVYVFIGLLLGIPVFFAVRAVFRLILSAVKNAFNAVENMVEFKKPIREY